MAKKQSAEKSSGKSAKAAPSTKTNSSNRELIDTGHDKRYIRRDEQGQFKESDDVGRSLAQDRRNHAKATVKAGQGDKGDQRRKN